MNQPTLADYVRSIVRVGVAALAGFVALWVARLGVKVDSATIAGPLTAGLAFGYYAVVRALEHRWPKFGHLLGLAGAPQYNPAPIELSSEALDRFFAHIFGGSTATVTVTGPDLPPVAVDPAPVVAPTDATPTPPATS